MHVLTHTQPGVQKQPSHTLRVAVFLILENLTGYDLLLHLKQKGGKSLQVEKLKALKKPQ